ncbi:MAG TPA: ADOP family duplicated permease [Gemmatimonadaceae bacterium]|nr:ADOP family duplicated permease [Gemmatimonadaceae bacterium]
MPTPVWRRYLRFWRPDVRADIDDELRFHLSERVEELTLAGASPDDARRQAIAELGDLKSVAAALREIDERVQRSRGSTEWLDRIVRDVRYALRGFRRTPVVTATIVITLALGVGANVAVLSLADRLFVRPPDGITRAAELRRIYTRSTWTAGGVPAIKSEIGYPQFGVVAASMSANARVTAYTPPDSVVVGRGDDRSVVLGSYVDASFFPVLGVAIERGRSFAPNEVRFGSRTLVAVISDGYWRNHFGGDNDIVGREAWFDRQRYTIIGVAGGGFRGADLNATDVWLPISNVPDDFPQNPWYVSWRRSPAVRVVARLSSGTPDAALAAAATAAFRHGELENAPEHPDTATVLIGPILESLGPSIRPKTEVAIVSRLLGVALVLLLVACANVANLLLARAVSRRREVAVRLALGVSRARLIMQLLVESVTLSLMAGVIAATVGLWSGSALTRLILPDRQLAGGALDWRTASATFVVSILTGVVAGIAPALHARRSDLARALKAGARDRAVAASRLRPAFVVAQTALSLVLIVGAGLFAKSLRDVKGIDVGYDVDRLAFGTVFFVNDMTNSIDYFNESHRAEKAAGLQTALDQMARAPGVESVALTTHPPLGGYAGLRLFTDSGAVPLVNDREGTAIAATSSFYATSGLELRRGRWFGDADDAGSEPVVVVSETAARAYWPGREALGQCLRFIKPTNPCTRVIGVTKDSHLNRLIEGAAAEAFLLVSQQTGFFGRPAYLLVRAAPGQVAQVTMKLRSVLRTVFPTAEPPYVRTVSSLVEPELRPWRLGAALFAVFGGLALLVAAIGVYSAMAYSVNERIGELGIRAALGASGANILRLIVGDAARMVGAGIVCGLAMSLAAGRLVSTLLYATSPRDPLVLGVGAGVLALLAIGSSAVPAWRAARADPMSALRAD